jgi:arylsulfatase A-like enzyme
MNRKNPLGAILLAMAFLGVATLLALNVRPRGASGPSILLVTVDTLRADRLGCYGHAAARTPHMDSLAREGALFVDATTPCPITLPAHATLLTGLLPPRHGLRVNSAPEPLPPRAGRPFVTAAEIFGDAGFSTAAFVSATPVARRTGLHAGFEVYDGPERNEEGSLLLTERDARATVDRAIGFLRARPKNKPFFLWVHLFDPHHPYAPPEGRGASTDSPEAYDDEIAWADVHLGRLLAELRSEGTLDRTVVAATSDHGEGLGEHGETTHGFFLYRSTLRVPLLVRYPPAVKAGTRVEGPVTLADVLPTVLSLAGRELPRGNAPLDGAPRLGNGAASAPPGTVQYAETLYGWDSFRWSPCCSARDGNIRTLQYGGERREVYDLAGDPGESRELSAEANASAASTGASAWALLSSRPLTLATASTDAEGIDPIVASLPYLGAGGGDSRAVPWTEVNRLPLPSTSLLTRIEAAVRLVGRAASIGPDDANTAHKLLEDAREALKEIQHLDPLNPALPYWIGRTWTVQGRIVGEGSLHPWYEAFAAFKTAAELGYYNAGTVSEMLHAAHQARQYEDMRQLARTALDKGMDGGTSFWCWIALAEASPPARLPDGSLPASARAAADAALQRAEKRAKDEVDRKRVNEVRDRLGR